VKPPKLLLVAALLGAIACESVDTDRGRASNSPPSSPTGAAPNSTVPALPIIPLAAQASKPQTPAPAATPTTAAAAETRAQRFEALQKEHDDAMNAYYDLFDKAKSDEERRKVAEAAKPPDVKPFLARAQALIDENATDDVALDVIVWMLGNGRRSVDTTPMLAAIEAHHMQSEKLADTVRMLVNDPSPKGRALVERLLAESPHAKVRGNACYALAQADLESVRSAQLLQGEMSAKDLASWKQYQGEEKVERLKTLDVAATQKHGEALLERIVKEFADVPYHKSTLGESAQGDLYELRELGVGKTAPDIAGEDLASTTFKLSEYRGKVVMLDFWGNW
jgi:hypothetical protein